MNRQERIALIVLVPTILVLLGGYFVFSSGGIVLGGGGGNDVTGEWVLTVPLDTEDFGYDEGDPEAVEVLVEFDRDGSGALVGAASAEYDGEFYNLEVLEIVEVDGKTDFKVDGTNEDSDRMAVWFYDEADSPGELEGTTDGILGQTEPRVAGTFTGERQ